MWPRTAARGMRWPISGSAPGSLAWEQEARWGEHIPNTELPLLADDMHGLRAIELGCGTGYMSAWMRRRGAAVYAIDNSDTQHRFHTTRLAAFRR